MRPLPLLATAIVVSGQVAGLALGTAPARAEPTVQSVVADWQALAQANGATLAIGTSRRDGEALRLADVTLRRALGDGAVMARLTEVTLRPGTTGFAIDLAPGILLDLTAPGRPALALSARLDAPGLRVQAQGAGGPTTLAAPEVTLTLTALSLDGSPVDLDALLRLSDVTAALPGQVGASATAQAARGTLEVESRDTRQVRAQLRLADLALNQGATALALSHAGAEGEATIAAPGRDTLRLAGTAGPGALDATWRDRHLDLAADQDALSLTLAEGGLFDQPVTLGLDRIETRASLPARPGDTPLDVALSLRLAGLAPDAATWARLDPDTALPRDPVSGEVVLSGKARLTGPGARTRIGPFPAEVTELRLDRLALSLLGAEVQGSGAVTLDNADLTTFRGLPAPEGSVTLDATGLTALMGQLVGAGLLPQDIAIAGQFMLGMFATPTGEDAVTTTIDVSPEGGIRANRQRLN